MFTKYSAYQELHKLKEKSIDMSEVMTPERIGKMVLSDVGFHLLYAAEKVDDEIMKSLHSLAKEADVLKKISAMQSGEVINKIEGVESEDRSVLHTATRDQFDNAQSAPAAKQAAEKAAKELKKLQSFLEKTEDQFTDIIQIGIGGSDLGPRALAIALQPYYQKGKRAHFISNVDPDDANGVIASVDLKKTLVVVVSKSGNTLETLTNEEFVRDKMTKMGLNPKDHFLAVTGEKSPMDNPEKYLESFYIWDFIGGRYSATSMVGAVSLSFVLGYHQFVELLKGAHDMDVHARTAKIEENLPLTSALLGIWNRNFLDYPTVAIIPYSQALLRFPAHLQQLDMESNGKRIDKTGQPTDFSTGPIIWGEPGTNGQHSFYQLIHQGTNIVPLEFVGFHKCQRGDDLKIKGTTSQQKLLSNLFAQSIALAVGQKSDNPNKFFPGNRPNRIMLGEKLTPYSLGALLSYYENKVDFQGFIWNINSFDQEGVQLGKVLANKMLDAFQGKEGAFPLGEAYLKFLDK